MAIGWISGVFGTSTSPFSVPLYPTYGTLVPLELVNGVQMIFLSNFNTNLVYAKPLLSPVGFICLGIPSVSL